MSKSFVKVLKHNVCSLRGLSRVKDAQQVNKLFSESAKLLERINDDFFQAEMSTGNMTCSDELSLNSPYHPFEVACKNLSIERGDFNQGDVVNTDLFNRLPFPPGKHVVDGQLLKLSNRSYADVYFQMSEVFSFSKHPIEIIYPDGLSVDDAGRFWLFKLLDPRDAAKAVEAPLKRVQLFVDNPVQMYPLFKLS